MLLWVVIPTAFGVGRVVATPLVFGLAGLMLLGFVLGYSGLSRRIRHPGGLYVQVTSGLGRSVGLGAAGLLFIAYIGLASGIYGLTGLLLQGLIATALGVNVPIGATLAISILAVQGLSLAPLRKVARILIVIVGIQVVIALWFSSSAFSAQAGDRVSVQALDPGWLFSGSFVIALILVLTVGFIGSEGAAVYSNELVNPYKSIPIATYLSYGVTTTILVLGSWAVSGAVGPEDAVNPNGALPMTVLSHLAGFAAIPAVQYLGFVAMYFGLLSTGVTLNNGGARQLAGLAQDGVLPRSFAAGTAGAPPARAALLVQPIIAAAVAVAAVLGTGNPLPLWLAVASGLGVLGVLALASAAAAVWFMRGAADETGFLGWEGQVIAGLFSVATIGLVFGYGVTHVRQVAPGSPAAASWLVGALIAGTFTIGLAGAQYLRARRPTVYASIGGTRIDDERVVRRPVPSEAVELA